MKPGNHDDRFAVTFSRWPQVLPQ